MEQQMQIVRLALSSFDDPDSLWDAVSSLVDVGLTPDRLCLAGRVGRLTEVVAAGARPAQELGGLDQLVTLTEDWLEGGLASRPDRGPVAGAAIAECLRSIVVDPGHHGMAPDHRRALAADMAKGAVVLVVRCASLAEQAASARALLKRSSHGVKTYERARVV